MTSQQAHPGGRARPTTVLAPSVVCLALARTLILPLFLPLPASAAEPIAVTDIKPLLMRAAAQGAAHGVLTGAGAAYVQRRFDTTSPIEIDVRRLHVLAQAGCGRLEVTTRQRVVLIDGKRGPRELVYQLSFCADGRFAEKQ